VPLSQLFSLPYSCAKRIHAAASTEQEELSRLAFAMNADSAVMVMRLAGQLYNCKRKESAGAKPAAAAAAKAAAARSSTSSSSASSSSASAAVSTDSLVLMLMARGAVAAGEALAALAACDSVIKEISAAIQVTAHAGAALLDEEQQIKSSLDSALQRCLGCIRVLQASVTGWDLPADAAVRDSMQQKLLRVVQKLQEEVTNAQAVLAAGASTASSSSSGETVPAAFSALLLGLSQQLVACGEALAALCPVPLCCNSPGCTELRGASEPQLVAGKGCVCSRCKWVAFDDVKLLLNAIRLLCSGLEQSFAVLQIWPSFFLSVVQHHTGHLNQMLH
jgi:hypothetical protein